MSSTCVHWWKVQTNRNQPNPTQPALLVGVRHTNVGREVPVHSRAVLPVSYVIYEYTRRPLANQYAWVCRLRIDRHSHFPILLPSNGPCPTQHYTSAFLRKIYLGDREGATLTIVGGAFRNNIARESGGLIAATASSTVVEITGGIFSNNTAT